MFNYSFKTPYPSTFEATVMIVLPCQGSQTIQTLSRTVKHSRQATFVGSTKNPIKVFLGKEKLFLYVPCCDWAYACRRKQCVRGM